MKKLIAAVWSKATVKLFPSKKRRAVLCAASLGVLCLCPSAFAGPDPGVTNGSAVFYTGNQADGVLLQVSSSSPAIMVVSNLSGNIHPATGVAGVQIGGSDTSRNLTAIIDPTANVFVIGDNASGIVAENGGGDAGTFQLPPPNFTITNALINGTNFIIIGSYDLATNSMTITNEIVNGTNTVVIVTNVVSGLAGYTNLVPAGGVSVINQGHITASGNNANGILAESLPGSISITVSNVTAPPVPYGDAGPVTVFNNGDISTQGTNSHGIFAQSIGGFGPENSFRAGNGSDVSVTTAGGSIVTRGDGSIGIFAQSRGGDNKGGESGGAGGDGRTGGLGGDSGQVIVTGTGAITTYSNNSEGIFALSQAGNGGNGGNGGTLGGSGGNGGSGGKGSNVVVNGSWNIVTYGTNSSGISAQSLGGRGGDGGNGSHFIDLGGGNGGGTGDGGKVTVISGGTIQTHGIASQGIFARSLGGFAGSGGDSYNAFYGDAGNGNSAGAGQDVLVANTGDITTTGDQSQAIYAESVGGGGGAAGSGGALVTLGSSGGAGGNSGVVTVTNSGTLLTFGSDSHGIEAQSLGGGGGDGGSAGGLVSLGGQGSIASTSQVVNVYNTGNITTSGSNSYAILAQSIGGGGGNAGSASGASALGASGGGGGNGAAVHVFNTGNFSDSGLNSYGLFAQSIGGGGGNGGGGSGLAGVGGSGGTSSKGDVVTVFNSGSIFSLDSAIFAQSIGGGGGNGGNGAGWFSVGGSGAAGSDAASVTVNNSGNLRTTQDNASALFAQSIGGGGGNGGGSLAVGLIGSLAIGGSGGAGGNGGAVMVTTSTNFITTLGNNSYGIDAESVGGGGGSGGYAISDSLGKDLSVAVAIGGSAAGGGSASNVTVVSDSFITTAGTNSHGIFAQSIGGGGGVGGFSIAVSESKTASLALSMGGTGGGGGNGGIVNLTSTGDIITTNQHSYGILAQSVGGGGGDGGFAIAGAISSSGGVSAALAFGGSGATGGVSRAVTVLNSGNILTLSDDSVAILAQSVGGGGGSGGFSAAGGFGGTAIGASFGGPGAGAGGADTVTLNNTGNLMTFGDRSDGIIAQSVGGGGGAGGLSVAGDVAESADLGLSFGGNGGTGGSASSVALTNSGIIVTHGSDSRGIFAQSVGGGGGDGGMSVAAGIGKGGTTLNAAMAFGGNATTGGVASAVAVINAGMIETFGTNSDGILAQSIGGGGGAGGLAVAGTLPLGTNSAQLSVSVGGNGGIGNLGGMVTVGNSQQIVTHGNDSIGIFAQSVGGGGGNGGMSFAGALSQGTASTTSLAIGGDGGTGGDASSVSVNTSGNIFTDGDRSHGILAQSIGGGGGNGGLAAALDFSLGTTGMVTQFAISIGGSGGAGGVGGNVFVGGTNSIVTTGQDAYGVFAQSVGGGGGSGGMSIAATVVLGASQGTNRAATFAIGGGGGDGNKGGDVLLNRSGAIETSGDGSYGIMAQSIGGGGGDGGSARSFSLFTRGGGSSGSSSTKASKSESINISIGGAGGTGNDGGNVTITNVGDITTHGADAFGIFAQSIGGGGGDGGSAHSSIDNLVPTSIPGIDDLVDEVVSGDAKSYQVVVGGNGLGAGNGNHVMVNDAGSITTWEDGSYGIFAQSVGGGGGTGGLGGLGDEGTLGIGGQGGASGNGGTVDVIHSGNIFTAGNASTAIFAQSVGGGGGVAGNVDRGFTDEDLDVGRGFAYGQDGGAGGDGGVVNVINAGNIVTGGNGADGIFAQSVGGGGGLVGNLGNNIPVVSFLTDYAGSVGNAGSGGDVTVIQTGDIVTYGTNSTGIFAQSAGGTNGVGGNVHVTLNGSIFAQGVNSDGIYAQSGGGATVVTPPIPTAPQSVEAQTMPLDQPLVNGDMIVTISTNGFVQGGSGNAVGVRFMNGVNNTLNNYGTVTTLGGLAGTAISGTSGNDQINNFGTVVGSVNLGAGGNSFHNELGAVLFAGNQISLGAGNALANDGIISLGDINTMQTSALDGNFQQSTNGSLQVKLAAPTTYDALNITGTAALDGNLSVFRFDDYLPTKGTAFNILTATNVTGQFASLADPFAGNYALRLQTIYSPTNVTLQVVQDSFMQFGHTGNQRSVAKALNSVAGVGTTGGNSRETALIAFMDTQNASQLPADFDLISPDELGSMFDLNFAAVNLVNNDIHNRMSAIRAGNRDGSGGLSYVDNRGNAIQLASINNNLPPMHTVKNEDDWGIFVNGNGQYVDVEGSTNASGYHFDSTGITLGADKMVAHNISVGFTLDYAGTKASLVNNGSVNVDSGGLGMYGTWFSTNGYVEASLGSGYSHYVSHRAALEGIASGHTDGFNGDALVGGGLNWHYHHLSFGPQASAQYTYVGILGFTEQGSVAPLQLQYNDSQSLLTQLGAHVAYDWWCHKVLIRPELQLGWQHECLDDNRSIESKLATGAGSLFTVNSPTVGRDSLATDLSLTVKWTSHISTFLSYHGDFLRQNYTEQSGSGGVSVSF